jgi:hypothetical protein
VDWPGLVKRYVWDEEKTPYLVRPGRLTPRQARSELFVYAFLLAVLAAVLVLVAAAGDRPGLRVGSPAVTLYGLALLGAAIVLGTTAHPAAAAGCATAPLVTALAALVGLLPPGASGAERAGLAAFSALWLGYAARAVRITLRLRGQG